MTGLKYRCVLLAVACCLIQIPAFAADVDSAARHTEYMVEMHDGVKLATSVYLPERDGPWPSIITRTPCNEGRFGNQAAKNTIYYDTGHSSAIVLPVISQ